MSAIVLPRRKFLAGLAASFIAASAIVRAASLMKVTAPRLFSAFDLAGGPGVTAIYTWRADEMLGGVLERYSAEIAANITRSNALLRHLRIAA